MVTVLIDYLFTGACHAPVRSKQEGSWYGAYGKLRLDGEVAVNLIVVKKGERYNETGKMRI